MSDKPKHDWLACIISSDLNPVTRSILHTLSMHMDIWGESCYPTIAQLSYESGYGRSTIINHLGKAEALGWIIKQEHGFAGQKWRNHEYVPSKPEGAKVTPWKQSEAYLKTQKRGLRAGPRNSEKVVPDMDYLKNEGGPAQSEGGPAHDKGGPAQIHKVVPELDPSSSISNSCSSSISNPLSVVPKKQAPPKKKVPVTRETWQAYKTAYATRYGADPIWNATVGGMFSNLVKQLGETNAPHVAAHYLTSNMRLYVEGMHPVNLLIRDCGKLHTEWVTNTRTTSTQAQQLDKRQNNLDVGTRVFEKLQSEGRISE